MMFDNKCKDVEVLSFEKLGVEQKREMEKHTQYNKDTMESHFDSLASNYDPIMDCVGYPDPDLISNYAKLLHPSKRAEIIDFGCGTGKVAESLAQAGFDRIVGVDCSEAMLHEAQQKGVYCNLEKIELGGDEWVKKTPVPYRNKFDVCTAAGLIDNNIVDESLFEQMMLSLKKGGHAIFTVQFSYLGHFWWSDKLKELESAGRMKQVKSEEFFKYENLKQNTVGKFSKTPMKVFVF